MMSAAPTTTAPMTDSHLTDSHLTDMIAAERSDLADLLAALPAEAWDLPTLCAGWRVRDLVAHVTMPFRYSTARFVAELARSRGNFTAMADRCARRDGAAPPADLLSALRDTGGVSPKTGCGSSWTRSPRRPRASTSAPT